jgi:hypothetical protein
MYKNLIRSSFQAKNSITAVAKSINYNNRLILSIRFNCYSDDTTSKSFIFREGFASRHIGISKTEQREMLETINCKVKL